MITIIVSTYRPDYLKSLEINIQDTINCEYELIAINSQRTKKGICGIYNEGAANAKYDVLCFVHEDVLFKTNNWGNIISKILEEDKIGLIGVAGGLIKTKAPGPTWWSPMKNSTRLNIVQYYSSGERRHLIENPENEKLSQVAVVDGVFMACRKEVWRQYPFDDRVLKGFHFYDLDFSLTIGGKYRVLVTYDILLEHFSEGKNDKIWSEQADIIHKKWNNYLPRFYGNVSNHDLRKVESEMEDYYLNKLFENKCSIALQLKYVIRRFLNNPSDFKTNIYHFKKIFHFHK